MAFIGCRAGLLRVHRSIRSLAAVGGRLFSFTWPHPKSFDQVDYSKEPRTLVEFRLEKTATGTLLLLTESGFEEIPSDRRVEAFRRNDGGWTEQMKNIESYVAKKP